MNRWFGIVSLIILLMTANAYAGFSSYNSAYSSDSVIAPIQIKDKGIYNLVISIQFLNEPYNRKPYETDGYEYFIRRLKVEWSGVALLQVLKTKEPGMNDLVLLKENIEAEILKLAESLKGKYSIDQNAEVVFSLSNFFLLEPSNK
ncbi:MAG: hypothetical protein P8X63_04575 [Desulfuromonadaceae bacterium]